MTTGARMRTSDCPNGQIHDRRTARAVEWNRSIMEVHHARA
jgi:hypothetical protein